MTIIQQIIRYHCNKAQRRLFKHRAYRDFCLWLFAILALSFSAMGCSQSAQVIFSVASVSPSADGSFTNRCCGFHITPQQIRIVMGDFQLLDQPPERDPLPLGSLPPIIMPGEADWPSEKIGQQGKFPGLWAINITKGATPHQYPVGYLTPNSWQQIQLRLAPAISGVRGLTAGDPIAGRTLLFEATAQRDPLICKFRIRVAFELGLARRLDFQPQPSFVYRNTIEIDYSKWLDDIRFDEICPQQPQDTLQITNETHPQIVEQLRTAMPISFTTKIGAATAL
jgi:hypothetical protein